MKLKVLKGVRLVAGDPTLDERDVSVMEMLVEMPSSIRGAVYIEGDVVEPNAREGAFLLKAFPDHFEPVK